MAALLLKNWKLIAIGALIIALGALWQIDKLRIGKVRNELKQSQIDLTACQDANKSNMQTIEALKAEAVAANATCSQRLAAKDNLINRLKDIDQIKEPTDAKDYCNGDRDALFTELERMFSPVTNRQN